MPRPVAGGAAFGDNAIASYNNGDTTGQYTGGAAFGNGAQADKVNNGTALGTNARATADNSVALGAGSVASRANTVSVGTAGNERQITNVAEGTSGTDAVNVTQLRRTGALAAALSGLSSLPYDPRNKAQIAAGYGNYHSASAVALGINYYFNDSAMMNIGYAMDGGDSMARLGVTWRFGAASKKPASAETTANIENLKKQVQQQQDQIQQMQSQIEQLKKMITKE